MTEYCEKEKKCTVVKFAFKNAAQATNNSVAHDMQFILSYKNQLKLKNIENCNGKKDIENIHENQMQEAP